MVDVVFYWAFFATRPRNGQKDQAVLWGIRHQNRYAEDADNSTDQPEKHCGARDDTYADQRKQVDCQRDRGG